MEYLLYDPTDWVICWPRGPYSQYSNDYAHSYLLVLALVLTIVLNMWDLNLELLNKRKHQHIPTQAHAHHP